MKKIVVSLMLLLSAPALVAMDDIQCDYESSSSENETAPSRYFTIGLEFDVTEQELEEVRQMSESLGATIVVENLLALNSGSKRTKQSNKSMLIASSKPYHEIRTAYYTLCGVKFVSIADKLVQ